MSRAPDAEPGHAPGTRQRGTSRAREQRLRRGGLFVPLVFAFAAQLEGMPVAEFMESPTKLTSGLRSVFGHFGVDGVVCWSDDTAPAATLSCPLDWSTYPPGVAAVPPPPDPGGDCAAGTGEAVARARAVEARLSDLPGQGPTGTAVEVVRRMATLLPDTVLVASVPGPVTLARQLGGLSLADVAAHGELLRLATKACLTYTKALGEAGLDVLLVREEALAAPGAASAADLARLYSPIWNTARHYGLIALLAPGVHSEAALVALAAAVDGVVVPPHEVPEARRHFKRVGVVLPAGLVEHPDRDLRAYLNAHDVVGVVRGGVFLVTTDGEVPLDIGREALIAGVETMRELISGGIERD
ncbi:MAG: hypothetical protein MUQ56_12240 [Thermoleophilia bacterium]|nr:hypothetical protein [Thermoleophilia bacterium]